MLDLPLLSPLTAKGKAVDATQEMIALGLSNIAGSFVRSMPVTGSFTRTAVNNASGVRTPAGGIFTGTENSFTSVFHLLKSQIIYT